MKKTEKQWKTNHKKKTNKILLDQKNVKNWSSDFFIICQKNCTVSDLPHHQPFWVVLPPNPLILCLVLCCFRFHFTVQCMSAGKKTNLLELLTFLGARWTFSWRVVLGIIKFVIKKARKAFENLEKKIIFKWRKRHVQTTPTAQTLFSFWNASNEIFWSFLPAPIALWRSRHPFFVEWKPKTLFRAKLIDRQRTFVYKEINLK